MRLQIFGHFVFVCKNQKNQFSVNDSLGGIRFWPATWDAITVSYIFLALQNCMRYIYTQKNESRLSGPPVHRIPVPAFHGKVHLRSNLYAQHKSCGQHEPTQQCCFHQMEHSAPLEWWRSSHGAVSFLYPRALYVFWGLGFEWYTLILALRLPRSATTCQSEHHQRPWLHSEVSSLLTTDVGSYRLADVSFTQLGRTNSLKS